MTFSSSPLVRSSIIAVFFATALSCTLLPIQSLAGAENQEAPDADWLAWNQLPDLPEDLGVSGPFVGVQNDALIVAGGTNFPQPTWETSKQWHGEIYVLTSVYVMSGRHEDDGEVKFLRDAWQYTPKTGIWRNRAELPRPAVAGVAASWGQSHILVLGGDDGELFGRADELKDAHPGFKNEALAYHTITDSWTSAGSMPQNKVTTIPVIWEDRIVLACGEIRPRIRTPQVWTVRPKFRSRDFGTLNYVVLILYLLAMVAVGIFFAKRNKDTNDYFRGGMHIPWWAAGCSIFATMLSSLTFTGVPSKVFAQDWVYAVGNF